jgi:transcriptional regulator with XRE-family HTH domain
MELIKTKEKFIDLRAQGYSYDKIAKELNKAKQTLIEWNKDLQGVIAERRAYELEALYEAYKITKEGRLRSLGETLNRLRDEIARRDLSEVPTEKLLDLLIKYSTQVKDEVIEPDYSTHKPGGYRQAQ